MQHDWLQPWPCFYEHIWQISQKEETCLHFNMLNCWGMTQHTEHLLPVSNHQRCLILKRLHNHCTFAKTWQSVSNKSSQKWAAMIHSKSHKTKNKSVSTVRMASWFQLARIGSCQTCEITKRGKKCKRLTEKKASLVLWQFWFTSKAATRGNNKLWICKGWEQAVGESWGRAGEQGVSHLSHRDIIREIPTLVIVQGVKWLNWV